MALADIDTHAAGIKSGEVRRANALERAQRAEIVETITDGIEREEIGPKLLQMAAKLATDAASTTITPETALELKQLSEAASILHKMARLELGESTSNQATFHVGDAATRKAELLARLQGLDTPTP